MSRAVLDASAVIALLFQETGAELVTRYMPGSLLSAVNQSEAITKSLEAGMTKEEVRLVMSELPCEIVPFDGEQAFLAAELRKATRPFGLSLADRACLALGLETGSPVVTADRQWDQCDIGVKLIMIR